MDEKVNIDEINDIMTSFLNNVVEVAKIHTEYKAKLKEEHEYTKVSCTMVKVFNQYQQLYVYISNPEEYAKKLVELSNEVLKAFSYPPFELMEGRYFKKRKRLRMEKPLKEESFRKINEMILEINEIINEDMKRMGVNLDGLSDSENNESE